MILASGSPRRRELLSLITADFTVEVSDADETLPDGLSPAGAVEYLARLKGEAVAKRHPSETVIASDTVVVLDGKILGKPQDADDAVRMLVSLSGRDHAVYTGVWIANGDKEICFHERTKVRFYPLTRDEIAAYVATGEPLDKAGAYGIQGRGALLIEGIEGDYYTVVGFPVARVARALKELGRQKKA